MSGRQEKKRPLQEITRAIILSAVVKQVVQSDYDHLIKCLESPEAEFLGVSLVWFSFRIAIIRSPCASGTDGDYELPPVELTILTLAGGESTVFGPGQSRH